jgi:hypothetical protein
VCHDDGESYRPSITFLLLFDVAVLPLLIMYSWLLFWQSGLFAFHYGRQEFDTDQVHVCGPVERSLIAARLQGTVSVMYVCLENRTTTPTLTLAGMRLRKHTSGKSNTIV